MRTLEEWLELPDAQLAVEAAKVLTPGPWRHEPRQVWGDPPTWQCAKCGKEEQGRQGEIAGDCPIPDPLNIDDWNVAMDALLATGWIDDCARPRDYIIAAAFVAEKMKEGRSDSEDKRCSSHIGQAVRQRQPQETQGD